MAGTSVCGEDQRRRGILGRELRRGRGVLHFGHLSCTPERVSLLETFCIERVPAQLPRSSGGRENRLGVESRLGWGLLEIGDGLSGNEKSSGSHRCVQEGARVRSHQWSDKIRACSSAGGALEREGVQIHLLAKSSALSRYIIPDPPSPPEDISIIDDFLSTDRQTDRQTPRYVWIVLKLLTIRW